MLILLLNSYANYKAKGVPQGELNSINTSYQRHNESWV